MRLVVMAESHHPAQGLVLSIQQRNVAAISESAAHRGCKTKAREALGSGLELFGCLFLFGAWLCPEPCAQTDTREAHLLPFLFKTFAPSSL